MADKYTYKLANGKTLEIEADHTPTPQEVFATGQTLGLQGTDFDPAEFKMLMAEQNRVLNYANHVGTREERSTPLSRWADDASGRDGLGAMAGARQLVQGGARIGKGEYTGGASDVLRGGMKMAAPFMLPAAAITAPLPTALALAGGAAGGAAAGAGARALGASDDQAALAEDVGGLAAGGASTLATGPVRAAAQAARGPLAGGLNIASAALDNPIAGAISPRAPHLGRMAGGIADLLEPKPAPAPAAAPSNAGGRLVPPSAPTTPTAVAQDALTGLQAPTPAPVGTLPPARTAPPQQFRTTVPAPRPPVVPEPSPNAGGRLTGQSVPSFDDLLAQELSSTSAPTPAVSAPTQAPGTRGGNPGDSQAFMDEMLRRAGAPSPLPPSGTPAPTATEPMDAGAIERMGNVGDTPPAPTSAPEDAAHAAVMRGQDGRRQADLAATELLNRGLGVTDDTAAAAPASQTTATGRASRARVPGDTPEMTQARRMLEQRGISLDEAVREVQQDPELTFEERDGILRLFAQIGGGVR